MKKSLSICAFTIFMVLAASMEAHSQTRPARPGVRPIPPGTRPAARPATRPRTVSRPTVVPRRPVAAPRRHVTRPGTITRHRKIPRASHPVRHNYHARRSYLRSVNYARHLRQINRDYFYRNWILYPSARPNGYHINDNYPYYVFNGYQHRYSQTDYCDYQLVDSASDMVVRDFNSNICSYAYDDCARERYLQNQYEYADRYFCAETYQDNYGY